MNRLVLLFCTTTFFSTLSFSQYQYSRLNHIRELRFAALLYQKDVDVHTSVRPLNLWELDSVDSSALLWEEQLTFDKKSWLGRKLFNEKLIRVREGDVQLNIDPVVNFQLGRENGTGKINYVNTRGFLLEGRLGRDFTFYTSYLESQAVFPSYISNFSAVRKVVPGQGFARPYREEGFDYGMASAEVSYSPGKFFSFTLGQGRNFFGEGYRSMMLSDAAFNYPFFRIETSFWKIKYTNLWAQLYDINRTNNTNGGYLKKYLSSHFLSINITSRWNLNFFEAIVLGDTSQQQGIDAAFFNPVIFYRPVEFAVGSRVGNALLGAGSSYKIGSGLQAYGQFVLDEFSIEDLTGGSGSWVNKFGYQLGIKYYNVLGVNGLFARMEFNGARPYTYSHRQVLTNYGHYNQPLAHPWGANFNEGLLQWVYQFNRWEIEGRLHIGNIGLNSSADTVNWGADIYRSYNDNRQELGNTTGQGTQGKLTYIYLRGAWLVNPATGLKLEAGIQFRDLPPDRATMPLPSGNSQYFFMGLRTEFFNCYYDF